MLQLINSVMFSYTLCNHCMNKGDVCIWDPIVKKGGVTSFCVHCVYVDSFAWIYSELHVALQVFAR